MTIALREKVVGPYTVRELSMRDTMRVLANHPEGDAERGPALLGAAVFNGTGEPLGTAVLDLGTGLYQMLMEAYNEVTGRLEFTAGEQGNG
jgi:hypothetical protein